MAPQLAKKCKIMDGGMERVGRLVEVMDDGYVRVYIADRLNQDKNPIVKVPRETVKEM